MKRLFTPNPALSFYALLIKVLFPIWLLWQLSWHFAFKHWIDYQTMDVSLMISAKLGVESLFFVVSIGLLYRRSKEWTVFNIMILISIACLGINTIWQFLKSTF